MAGKTLCDVKINRTARGYDFFIKSPLIEEWMKMIADRNEEGDEPKVLDGRRITNHPTMRELKFYSLQGYDCSHLYNQAQAYDLNQGPVYNSKLNLNYLAIVGLGEGVTIHSNTPISRTMINQWSEVFRTKLAQILSEFVGPAEATIRITERDAGGGDA